MRCWGFSWWDLIDPTKAATGHPTAVVVDMGVPATSVSAGLDSVCAVGTDGGVRCRGAVVGSGPAVPVTGLPAGRVAQLQVGDGRACALVGTQVGCWGRSLAASGAAGSPQAWTPVAGTEGLDVVQLSMRDSHACVRGSEGAVRCWGHGGTYGALGRTATESSSTALAADLLDGPATDLATAVTRTCAVLSGDRVRCLGYHY